MKKKTVTRILAMTVVTIVTCAWVAGAQTPAMPEPAANPGRPSVSAPATLTPVGYLQIETGVLNARDSGEFSTRLGFNAVAKLAVHKRAQLFVSMEPFVRSANSDHAVSEMGGSSVGVQYVLFDGGGTRPTIAASYARALPGGSAPDLDIGSADQSVSLLLSADVAGFHVDTNAILNDQADDAGHRAQHGQTLSVSHAFGSVTLAGELWHFTQPLLDAQTVGNLWCVSYAARPNLVFDAGFNRGLTTSSTRWEIFSGLTYLVPQRLWGR